jgi:hypothetical protein
MYSGDVLDVIPRLPTDLQREIFKLIDIDTRLAFLLDGNLTFSRGNKRRELREKVYSGNDYLFGWLLEQQVGWFTEQEFSVIYKESYLCKLFQYDNSTRRWKLKADFVDMLPKTTFSGYTTLNLFDETSLITLRHPAFDMIEQLRMQDIGASSDRVCLALSLMINTNVFDINFNYYIRKIAFNMLVAMNIYKRTCIKSREIREDRRIQKEIERERIRAERMAMRNIEIEEKRNRQLMDREAEYQRAIQEREEAIRIKAEAKQLLLAERMRNKSLKAQRKITLQREKEDRRLFKGDQKAKIRQEKADRQVVRIEDKLKRVEMQATKRDLLRQKQTEKCHNQTLNYISKLFK